MKRFARRPEIWGLALAAAAVAWIGWPHSNVSAPAAQSPKEAGGTECARVVGSLGAARKAVGAAAPGSVVCLRDGEFGQLALKASKTRPGVTLRAEHPGKASLDGVSMDGKNLTVARFRITADVVIEPGSTGMTVERNRIGGGYFGVEAGPTTTVTVNDVAIVGNRFVGPFGEDAIRLNRYHDSDGDGIGALVSGNEFTNIRENGNHSDCLQTVWYGDHLVYTRNYVHDNRCQGFFVKDQAREIVGITVADNLFLRNNAPCPPGAGGDCGTPSDFQVFGPYRKFQMRHNTIWGNGANASFQEGTGPGSAIRDNVAFKFWTSTDLDSIRYEDNTRCQREASGGSWPRRTPGEVVDCDPAFRAPARDDYRLGNGRGVRWAPRGQHFGP
jgi:hypothetical protein